MRWRPTHSDPLFILAMDHRDSFGSSLFGVRDDRPTDAQTARMQTAKNLIYRGLAAARDHVGRGRPGVLVDEQYGAAVIDRAHADGMVLAVPIEASGHDWFTLAYPDDWRQHLERTRPDYAKVLVRDNPDLPVDDRRAQLDRLATVTAELPVPLLYELLVPATDEQKATVGGAEVYDRDLRPELVTRVIADNYAAGVRPALWKVEGLETADAARAVAAAVRAGDPDARLIVLGRDAPLDRLNHWLDVAATVDSFVGFAIGRSIWEPVIRDWAETGSQDDVAVGRIAQTYLAFVSRFSSAE